MGGRGQGLCDDSIKPYYIKKSSQGAGGQKKFKIARRHLWTTL